MTIPCPHCSEQIDSVDALWLDVPISYPMTPERKRLNATGFHSADAGQTVAKPESSVTRTDRKARFRT